MKIEKIGTIQIIADGGIVNLDFVQDKINEIIDQINDRDNESVRDFKFNEARKMLSKSITHLRVVGLTYRAIADVLGLDHPQKVKHYENYK